MNKIDITSKQYVCWHEAGHIVSCLLSGGKVNYVKFINDTEAYGRACTNAETFDDLQRRDTASGGYAIELLLYNKGYSDIPNRNEFQRIAKYNAQHDLKIFSQEKPIDNDLISIFITHAHTRVLPALEHNFEIIENIANELYKKGELDAEAINNLTKSL